MSAAVTALVFLEEAGRDRIEAFLAEHPDVHAVAAEQRLERIG
jgi:hypothetical protein